MLLFLVLLACLCLLKRFLQRKSKGHGQKVRLGQCHNGERKVGFKRNSKGKKSSAVKVGYRAGQET